MKEITLEIVHRFFNNTQNYLQKRYGILLRQEILNGLIGDISDLEILDIGCGDGSLSVNYATANQVTLLDVSENMLQAALNNYGPLAAKTRSFHGDFLEFDSSNKFDIILIIGVLAHVPHLDKTFAKLANTVKTDGKIYLQFTDYNHFLTKVEFLISGIKNSPYKAQTIRKIDIDRIIRKHGFKIMRKVHAANALLGMPKLFSERFILKYMRFASRNRVLRFMRQDYIYEIRLDS
ncbi:MAG: class I SAM-dependent methyltransferase [Saprospiraceae bacterium]|nr:class I SAM-dependent methyltransferase [Saprospiraceae bacterium]